MVSDMMLSWEDALPATDDAAEKLLFVHDTWHALFSGSPSPIHAVVGRIRARHAARPISGSTELEELACWKRMCAEAYQAERSEQITDRFLSTYQMSLEEFRREGYQSLGPVVFAEINNEIRNFNLGMTLLICGFDFKGFPHIFEVHDPGEVIDHDYIGYAAIGSGMPMALSVLAARSIKRLSWSDLLYRACEAKFTSETATGVGKATLVMLRPSNGIDIILPTAHIEKLRTIWETQRAIPPPSEAIKIIKNGMGIAGGKLD